MADVGDTVRLSTAAPPIQWYPGHIAKAEKALSANLEKVDLVIEVRDARIPLATGHPRLQRWIRGKQHLLVINRRDMVSPAARLAWDGWFRQRGRCPGGATPRSAPASSNCSRRRSGPARRSTPAGPVGA